MLEQLTLYCAGRMPEEETVEPDLRKKIADRIMEGETGNQLLKPRIPEKIPLSASAERGMRHDRETRQMVPNRIGICLQGHRPCFIILPSRLQCPQSFSEWRRTGFHSHPL